MSSAARTCLPTTTWHWKMSMGPVTNVHARRGAPAAARRRKASSLAPVVAHRRSPSRPGSSILLPPPATPLSRQIRDFKNLKSYSYVCVFVFLSWYCFQINRGR